MEPESSARLVISMIFLLCQKKEQRQIDRQDNKVRYENAVDSHIAFQRLSVVSIPLSNGPKESQKAPST